MNLNDDDEAKQSLATQDLLANKQSTFIWTSGSDVQKVWKRHGWIPPTEYRNDYMFGKNREIGKAHG
jgi:hypothetical protein